MKKEKQVPRLRSVENHLSRFSFPWVEPQARDDSSILIPHMALRTDWIGSAERLRSDAIHPPAFLQPQAGQPFGTNIWRSTSRPLCGADRHGPKRLPCSARQLGQFRALGSNRLSHPTTKLLILTADSRPAHASGPRHEIPRKSSSHCMQLNPYSKQTAENASDHAYSCLNSD